MLFNEFLLSSFLSQLQNQLNVFLLPREQIVYSSHFNLLKNNQRWIFLRSQIYCHSKLRQIFIFLINLHFLLAHLANDDIWNEHAGQILTCCKLYWAVRTLPKGALRTFHMLDQQFIFRVGTIANIAYESPFEYLELKWFLK